MAAVVIVSGPVLRTSDRSGTTTNTKDGQPRDWRMRFAHVLVADYGMTDVMLPDQMPMPTRGEFVDLICEVTTQGRVNAIGVAPAAQPSK